MYISYVTYLDAKIAEVQILKQSGSVHGTFPREGRTTSHGFEDGPEQQTASTASPKIPRHITGLK